MDNKEKNKIRSRKSYLKNRDRILASQKAFHKEHKQEYNKYHREYSKLHYVHKRIPKTEEQKQLAKEKQKQYCKEKMRKIRIQCLIFYGGNPPSCKCCGEKEIKFLSIDHINGGGNKHRKSIVKGKGGNINYWLLKNSFPEGFQVLCHNCNMAKGFYGQCPHSLIN